MKDLGSMLLTEEGFSELVMGNTAVVRGMIEAGTRVVASYPGSPTPEIATAIQSIPEKQCPLYFEFSTNEKVATEVAFGAALNGHLATVFFKSVGLNVAADTFVQLSLMNIPGGMVVILGDDPGANSSQNEQDNRHYARMSYTPMLEPADPQEAYEFYLKAADISRQLRMPVMLRLTTHVCHAKQKVHFAHHPALDRDDTPRFDVANGPYIPIASLVFPMKRAALAKRERIAALADERRLYDEMDNGNRRQGIITAGLPFLSLLEVLEDAPQKPDILKLGIVHPLPREAVLRFLQAHAEILVLEELDDELEREIKALAFDHHLEVAIHGKTCQEDWVGEYTPDKVQAVVAAVWPTLVAAPVSRQVAAAPSPRPPQLCPGCGHRSAFHAIRQALAEEDITVADIGCHTLGFLPPYSMGEVLMCMGASSGMAAGLSLFNTTRRVVAFIGDSTFFHAGLPGIINALFNRHNVTLVVMENGTTAMTGHQNHAASGRNANRETDAIPIRTLLEALGVRALFEVDTYRQAELASRMKAALAVEGFSVVIARHPCMLKSMRRQRRTPGFQKRQVAVDPDRCSRAYPCIEAFACPTFVRHGDGRITTNPELCIGDGSCRQTCPSAAIGKPQATRDREAGP
jgi:indolepyruvate ferredoxin oxidoreductase alpha subunit